MCNVYGPQKGYPREITAADQPASAGYWVVGRIHISAQSSGIPLGAYTLMATGTGSISFSGNVSPRTLTLPLPGGKATLQINTTQVGRFVTSASHFRLILNFGKELSTTSML
jgi:hypothetical protein